MPVSRATTAPISSSVCRLPFISASALPSRTSSTAFAAESWLCADSTSGKRDMSALACPAASRMRAGGPTRMGSISPSCAASTAPSIEISSQGCATAVFTGGSRCAACDEPVVAFASAELMLMVATPQPSVAAAGRRFQRVRRQHLYVCQPPAAASGEMRRAPPGPDGVMPNACSHCDDRLS